MISVIESLLEIFRSMPYGEQTLTFIKGLPPEIGLLGFVLGFFATAASWGEVDKKGKRVIRLFENIYRISGVIAGVTCVLLAGYLLLTQQLIVLFYICALIFGSMFNLIFQFIVQALGEIGHYILLFVGCISGLVVVLTAWLYLNGSLFDLFAG